MRSKSVDYIKKHPDEAAAIMAKGLNLPVDDVKGMMAGLRFADRERNRYFFDKAGPAGSRVAMLFDEAGGYWFRTIKPPPYPASANWMRPSHIHFRVVAPGAGTLVTQMYFAGDPYLARDYIFNDIADPAARANLVVTLAANPMTLLDGAAPPMTSFEIRLA